MDWALSINNFSCELGKGSQRSFMRFACCINPEISSRISWHLTGCDFWELNSYRSPLCWSRGRWPSLALIILALLIAQAVG